MVFDFSGFGSSTGSASVASLRQDVQGAYQAFPSKNGVWLPQVVDLDLDYRVHLDGRLERLDEQEYFEHQVSMHYPATVHEHVQAACAEVESLYEKRAYPFNYAEQVMLYRQIAA